MNKLKKLLLGLPLLGFLLPGCSFHIEKGKDEQGLEFHLKDNKEYYVSGGTSTNLTEIVVPETFYGLPVTGIKWPGFQKQQQMESITLPSTIKHLDNAVFYECTSLKSIVIPEGVTTISNIAFGKCTSLTSVLIPNSVNNIENGAFSECTSLECNEYDNGKYLGNPDNPYLAFVKAKDKTIETCKINDKCVLIASNAFSASSLRSIDIPGNVDSICEYAFFNCSYLSKVDIHDGVTFIGYDAFCSCESLTTISMPDSIACIESGVFSGCTSLECNEYDNAKYLGNPDNPYVALYKSKDDAIETCKINDNCKLILNHAFCFCEFLTEVEMPSSVRYIGDSAFNYCVKLSAFNYKGTAAEWDAIEKEGYWNFNCPAPVFFNYDGASA